MRIGLDFDNTIVCYDEAIAYSANKMFNLPNSVPRTKLGLRDYLRKEGREKDWTAFQGELYGPGMSRATPFEGAIESMQRLVSNGHELVIVSHRSLRPYAGPPHDLHFAAKNWIANRLQAPDLFQNVNGQNCAHFLETREKKLAMISDLKLSIFLDDLPEVLTSSQFPQTTTPILFNPDKLTTNLNNEHLQVVYSWDHFLEYVQSL